MIFTFNVTVDGNVIYSHDIMVDESRSFKDDVSAAIGTFRENFPLISLFDQNVEFTIKKKS